MPWLLVGLIHVFREFKSIWDPHGRMNPGKVIDAHPLDTNLRLGPDYAPRHVATHFQYPDDNGSFAQAAERCFGVGKCRMPHGQTMCPSFQATLEEMHSTRGRAHLLFEMMRGDPLDKGWREEGVGEALDLCLQCKGCKHDCPVSVDMATYKPEFLAHYYKGRLRPRAAYSMGLIMWWAPLAMAAPGWANLMLRTPGLGDALKAAAGFTTEREAPAFAGEGFQTWFQRQPKITDGSRPPVVLWPDTFNNYFFPGRRRAQCGCWRTPATSSSCPRNACAAAGRSTITACSTSPGASSSRSSTRCGRRSARDPGRRAGTELPLRVPRRATQFAGG